MINVPIEDNIARKFWGGEDQLAQTVRDGGRGARHHVHHRSRVQDQGNTG